MKSDRMLGIFLMLVEKERVSARELADRFEVSTRTIYRDVESLGRAGVPVYSVPGVGGGISIMPGCKVDRGSFSTEELSSVLIALNSLARNDDNLLAPVIEAKLRSLIPLGKEDEILSRVNQVRFDASKWLGGRDFGSTLTELREAIMNRVPVRISYMSQTGTVSERIVEPYRTINKAGAWYLQGFCRERSDYRLFKLSRIVRFEFLDGQFEPKECPEAVLDGSPIAKGAVQLITLRIHRSLSERVLDYVSFDSFAEGGDEHYLVTVPFIDREYYYGMLLSLGMKCEVVGPPQIREKMREMARGLGRVYQV